MQAAAPPNPPAASAAISPEIYPPHLSAIESQNNPVESVNLPKAKSASNDELLAEIQNAFRSTLNQLMAIQKESKERLDKHIQEITFLQDRLKANTLSAFELCTFEPATNLQQSHLDVAKYASKVFTERSEALDASQAKLQERQRQHVELLMKNCSKLFEMQNELRTQVSHD